MLKSGKHAELWPENKPSEKKKSSKSKKKKDNNPNQEGANNGEDAAKNDGGSDDNDGKDGEDDDDDGENEEAGGDSGGGGGGGGGSGNNGGSKKKKKKKKKKGQNGNSADAAGGGENAGDIAPAAVPGDLAPMRMTSTNLGPPVQHVYPYLPNFYNQQAPPVMYGLNYNTTYPSPSASYFAPSVHGNMFSDMEMYPPPSGSIHTYSDGDDDDDESGCSIM